MVLFNIIVMEEKKTIFLGAKNNPLIVASQVNK